MGMQLLTDIGGEISVIRSISPQAISGSSDVNGANSVGDRTPSGDQEYMSGVLTLVTGATTGTPTTVSVACRLQDSADGTSGWADIASSAGGPYAITAITAADSVASVNFNAKPIRRYVRAVATPTFTGGSSPTILIAATIALGGAQKKPTS